MPFITVNETNETHRLIKYGGFYLSTFFPIFNVRSMHFKRLPLRGTPFFSQCLRPVLCIFHPFYILSNCLRIDERQDVQKKTFTKWINSQLAKNSYPLVDDLLNDLRDGHNLLNLLEIFTNTKFVSIARDLHFIAKGFFLLTFRHLFCSSPSNRNARKVACEFIISTMLTRRYKCFVRMA